MVSQMMAPQRVMYARAGLTSPEILVSPLAISPMMRMMEKARRPHEMTALMA
eukprot:CAMPEP_0116027248 /NCGR_PEP_ID=MMETSP0321-20121206/14497_1 /TAXON_ID=163516 /ORGANISM="Leptocylindrus danicus var. danicus, Strain B650" /LENGTH=51 /DNA_ID=CAMNT_0003500529 /DNA_START=12 /DNA_END=164 /DNA_ORIENTATION=-